ncbi:hypothetical protein A8C56_11845 [Niabella ginsenosidivorans]|uniref:Uncharacterized protein n=1 Tax=Niabella ginsenosidivorans TaxID=1176587 RepID=A0A1A9I4T9_9BACT|nr:hypothetical protein A8C56_11845 [Niabella ginsenosidivorans]
MVVVIELRAEALMPAGRSEEWLCKEQKVAYSAVIFSEVTKLFAGSAPGPALFFQAMTGTTTGALLVSILKKKKRTQCAVKE